MRVVEPHLLRKKPTKNSSRLVALLAVVALTSLIIGFVVVKSSPKSSTNRDDAPQETPQLVEEKLTDQQVSNNNLQGNDFRLMYDNASLRYQRLINVSPSITGDEIADAIIYAEAVARGYSLRTEAYDGLSPIRGIILQEEVHDSLVDLQSALKSAGHVISPTSAYRPILEQKRVFLDELFRLGVTVKLLRAGGGLAALDETLTYAAPPGYSKHHSGYALDFLCSGTPFREFITSPCHDWLTENNYKNARRFGFIPSYPQDADFQGPSPEAWEYVWVGEYARLD